MIEEIYHALKNASDETNGVKITMKEPNKEKARDILDKVYAKCKENGTSISIIEYFYSNLFRHIPPVSGAQSTYFLAFIYVEK